MLIVGESLALAGRVLARILIIATNRNIFRRGHRPEQIAKSNMQTRVNAIFSGTNEKIALFVKLVIISPRRSLELMNKDRKPFYVTSHFNSDSI